MAARGSLVGWIGIAVGVVALVAAGTMGAVLLLEDDEPDAVQATADGFIVEPANSIGPDAFTPPVDTGDATICDRAALVRELQARPDAYAEWARVLGIPAEEVPAFIESLTPMILEHDTRVTNHGLHEGKAYSRPSLLLAGTAVLAYVPPQDATTTAPSTVPFAPGFPVTRCRCGNPLLPPYTEIPPLVTTTTATTTPPTTSPPRATTTTSSTSTSTSTSTTTTTMPPGPNPDVICGGTCWLSWLDTPW